MGFYETLAVAVLVLHLLWIAWVVLGALLTRNRPQLRLFHIGSLIYSILIEILPWPPCPFTVLEQWLEARAGIDPYRGPFLVHYLDATVYPDIPVMVLIVCAVTVCLFNLGVYIVRYRRRQAARW